MAIRVVWEHSVTTLSWMAIAGGLKHMMGRYARSESLFFYFRLEDQVPETHLLRLVDKHIDFSFVREQLKDSYSDSGRPSIVGTPFAMPLVAQVQDERGMPVPGATVDFSGTGLSFVGSPAVTDANGRASVMATPTAAGSLTGSASVAGVATPATFKLTATQP